MAVQTRDLAVGGGEHMVQFYEHDSELVAAVAPYLAAGARAGEVVIVIATEAHRQAFAGALEADGIDLAQAGAGGKLISLDAERTLDAFMVDGQIDREAFHEVIGGLVRRAARSGRATRAFGEMVALLWDAGDVLAAIELETLWNELAGELPFSLFCSYPSASVSGSDYAEALHELCHLHSSVLQSAVGGRRTPPGRAMETKLAAEFAAERESPGRARRVAVATLRQLGHGDSLLDSAALLVSELATNAVLHAGSPFSIALGADDSIVRVAVRDGSPLAGTADDTGLIPQPLHGLGLIDTLATQWGVYATHDGKVVWAELSVINGN